MVNEILTAAAALTAAGDRGAMATLIEGPGAGRAVLVDAAGVVLQGHDLPEAVATLVPVVLEQGKPRVAEADGNTWFVEPVLPPPKLIVLGAIAAADALVPMAIAAGFAVHVIDTREWLADEVRYPGAASVRCGVPIERLQEVGVDVATSVVSFLHEARLEDEVLIEALSRPARYTGSMGSGKNSSAKRERLAAAGVDPTLLERLRAPIGLSIGSRTPQEMAVAVLAEVVAVGRGHG
ncbi:MAG: XdhC family protein [Acidimicrobiia bacterium]